MHRAADPLGDAAAASPAAGPAAQPTPPRVGIGVVVQRDGRVLLGERCGAHGAGTWALPGGHLAFGETPADCARREVLEETGLSIHWLHPGPYTSDLFADEGLQYVTLFVLAHASAGEPRVAEPSKCRQWDWFEWSRLPSPLFRPLQSLVDSGFVPPANGWTERRVTDRRQVPEDLAAGPPGRPPPG